MSIFMKYLSSLRVPKCSGKPEAAGTLARLFYVVALSSCAGGNAAPSFHTQSDGVQILSSLTASSNARMHIAILHGRLGDSDTFDSRLDKSYVSGGPTLVQRLIELHN